MLVTSVILLKIFLFKFNLAEWIDMPQFSDETKVYRMPMLKQDHFHKFTKQTADDQFFYAYQNVTYKYTDNENDRYDLHTIEGTITEPTVQTYSKKEEDIINIKYDETTTPVDVEEQSLKKEYLNESLISNDEEMLQYLPVDILKRVHQTLKLQPTSNEGKIQFLKMFENTLITEIESRLTRAITTGREKRGAEHYDHGYDDHSAGFPSIEGALMAISFLTFAVYLVRLVMLLFRNINNSMTTTMNPTLLIGRRKRSTNKFDDDLAIMFKNIDNFSFKS